MRASLKNVLDLLHMSDVTTAALKSTRWHEYILRALQLIRMKTDLLFAATVLFLDKVPIIITPAANKLRQHIRFHMCKMFLSLRYVSVALTSAAVTI